MKTYSTYQEAKIENPECEIVTTAKGWDGRKESAGKFEPLVCGTVAGAHWLDDECGWIKCNPADYCMTVEKFLSDGNEFVDGDLWISPHGRVKVVGIDCPSSIVNQTDYIDCKRFILRAAALENKESDYDRGMREAMKAIAKSCGRTFGVDVGYADLPAIVESMVNHVKKPRTRVEYVSVTDANTGDELFAKAGESYHKVLVIGWHPLHPVVVCEGVEESIDSYAMRSLYRKVETEIDERQEFVDASFSFFSDGAMVLDAICKMFDSGKFKYTGGDDADK